MKNSHTYTAHNTLHPIIFTSLSLKTNYCKAKLCETSLPVCFSRAETRPQSRGAALVHSATDSLSHHSCTEDKERAERESK